MEGKNQFFSILNPLIGIVVTFPVKDELEQCILVGIIRKTKENPVG